MLLGLNCTLPPRFFERELDCHFLGNFGTGSIIMFSILFINLTITCLFYIIYDMKVKVLLQKKLTGKIDAIIKTRGYRVLSWLDHYYGIRFFRVRMEGIPLEIFVYSFINIGSDLETLSLSMGSVISCLYLTFYAVSNYYTIISILELIPRLRKAQENIQKKKKVDTPQQEEIKIVKFANTKSVKDVIDFACLTYAPRCLFLGEYKANIHPLLLFTPMINLTRSLLVSIMLIGLSRSGMFQLIALGILESCYLYFIIKSAVKVTQMEHQVHVLSICGYLFYMLCSMLTYIPVNESSLQLYVGGAMAVGVIISTLLILFYVFIIFSVKIIIVPMVGAYHSLTKKKNATIERKKKEKIEFYGEANNDDEESDEEIQKIQNAVIILKEKGMGFENERKSKKAKGEEIEENLQPIEVLLGNYQDKYADLKPKVKSVFKSDDEKGADKDGKTKSVTSIEDNKKKDEKAEKLKPLVGMDDKKKKKDDQAEDAHSMKSGATGVSKPKIAKKIISDEKQPLKAEGVKLPKPKNNKE